MVLFCLNQIGNHIPNPFNHSAMWLPHSIKAAHNLWQRQEDLDDGIYFREMDVPAICVTSERKHLQAEKCPQMPFLLVAVCGSEVDMLLLELDLFLKIDKWEKMASPFSSPYPLFATLFSIWVLPGPLINVTLCNEQRKKWDWVSHSGTSLAFDLWWPVCAETWLSCPYLPLPQTIWSWEPLRRLTPVNRWSIRWSLFLVFSFHSYF